MKNQNKNQKAPETKLTDAQLGDVNAGKALANGQIAMAKKTVCKVEGKLDNAYDFQGKVGTVTYHLLGRD